MNTLPAPPRMPEIVPPTPTQVVQVSAAQVWSSAAQNLVIATIIGLLMWSGKVSEELGLIALSAVSGIDLFGRIKAKTSAAAALAVGASSFMSKLPHMLFGLVIGSAFLGGCNSLPQVKPPQSADDVAKILTAGLDSALWVCSFPVLERSEAEKVRAVCADLAKAKASLQGNEPVVMSSAGVDEDAGQP